MHYRTDTGVHSLDSPFAVDLQKNSGGDIFFDPKMITFRLNEVFKNKDVDIRVLKTVAVKSNFKARGSFSCQRTYLYRFAVLKTEKLSSHSDYFHSNQDDSLNHIRSRWNELRMLPLQDQPYITELKSPFDPIKAEKCVKLFEGKHNLLAFTSAKARSDSVRTEDGKYVDVPYPMEFFIRTISSIEFQKVASPLNSLSMPIYDLFDFYELRIKSPSFFRNQIRRMAAIMIAVAQDRLGLSDVSNMLENFETAEWPPCMGLTEPNGLYLAKVEYLPEYLEGATDDLTKLPFDPIEWDDEKFKLVDWEKMKENNIVKQIHDLKWSPISIHHLKECPQYAKYMPYVK